MRYDSGVIYENEAFQVINKDKKYVVVDKSDGPDKTFEESEQFVVGCRLFDGKKIYQMEDFVAPEPCKVSLNNGLLSANGVTRSVNVCEQRKLPTVIQKLGMGIDDTFSLVADDSSINLLDNRWSLAVAGEPKDISLVCAVTAIKLVDRNNSLDKRAVVLKTDKEFIIIFSAWGDATNSDNDRAWVCDNYNNHILWYGNVTTVPLSEEIVLKPFVDIDAMWVFGEDKRCFIHDGDVSDISYPANIMVHPDSDKHIKTQETDNLVA